MIVALPFATAVTSPEASTVATEVSLDSQENVALGTAWPLASSASAVSCTVAPNAASSAAAGDTSTEAADCITVTTADPEALPALAVIVACPSPTPVTRPVASTAATPALLLSQVTVAPVMTLESWSRTSAVSCTVAPNAVNSAAAGLTEIVVGRVVSGGGGVVGVSPSPHPFAQATTAATAHSRIITRCRSTGYLMEGSVHDSDEA